MATTQCPSLPTELWLRVLQNLQNSEDLPDLWTSYRHVCTTFKEAVEAIMRENHLRKTWIRFSLGECFDDDDDGKVALDSQFEFSHVSEDKTQATFVIDGCGEKYKPEVRERLEEAVNNRFIEAPQYEIQIHRDVNDSPIPGLSLHKENLELTFDWRGLYNIFFGEEQIYHRLLQQWTEGQEQWAIGIREKMERGELDMIQMMQQAVEGFAAGSENARKMARRARIRKEMKLNGIDWDADRDGDKSEEKRALKKLKDSRYLCSLETQSDDEDEETDRDADLSSDEEDEWEDEVGSDIEE